MTMFIIVGIVMTITIGAFISLILTSGMNSWKRWVVFPIVAILVGFGVAGLFTIEAKDDEAAWNNGYCECGGEWNFTNAEHIKNGGDLYYYECEECGDLIRTHRHFK